MQHPSPGGASESAMSQNKYNSNKCDKRTKERALRNSYPHIFIFEPLIHSVVLMGAVSYLKGNMQ